MNNTQKLKNIEPDLSVQQSKKLFNLYQEIMDMKQELEVLQKNNKSLQQQSSEKETVSTSLETLREITLAND